MKRNYLILFFLLSSITTAQQPIQPLQTLMEVEYVNSNYELGTGMLGLGDINSDGKPDFAVSAYNIRKTFIYYGGKGVLDDTVDLVIKGGGILGKGDLNGDDAIDFVVLFPGDSSTGYFNQLAIYFGREDSTIKIDTIPSLLITEEQIASRFGETFAIGDLDGDGFDDLVVGARTYGLDQGKVYVYFGKTNFNGIPDTTAEGDTVRSYYGYDIKTADINGDGIKDLTIASDRRKYNTTDNAWVNDGFLDIYYGKGGWQFTKNGYDQRFDQTNSAGVLYPQVFGLVDVNADGKTDISMVQLDSAYFFYGKSDSVRHIPDLILTNPDTDFYSAFAGAASDIGDINKDGKNDFALLLSPGTNLSNCMAVYLGNSTPQTKPIGDRCKTGNNPFDIIVNVGDVNSDGVNDFGSVAPRNNVPELPQDGYFIIFKGDSGYVTGIEKSSVPLPKDFNLYQNYPNPFNPSTTIEYTLQKEGKVELKIFDMLGKEIKTLVNKDQRSGNYEVVWDGTGNKGDKVSSGIYFYRLEIDKATITKKAIYLK